MMRRARTTGFTFIELVVSLTISAIVIGMAAMILTGPTEAYVDAARRGGQTDAADFVTRRLGYDLKRALPNSVRINVSGNRAILEMLVYDSVGFYRRNGEVGAFGPWTQAERELTDAAVDTRFSIFGRIDPDQSSSPYSYPGHFVAVANLGDTTLYDAYRPGNYVMTPARVGLSVQRDPTLEESVTMTPGFRFRSAASPTATQRMFFVTGPVAYICNATANTQTLRRFEDYAIANAQLTAETNPRLTAAGVTNELIADDVSACRFRCRGGATTARPCRDGLVVEIAVNRVTADGNETVRVFQQFPVDMRL